ncbi:guanine nucleotide binding protein, alpha subunit [Entophlyctis helioformis]|nr:guanine nucleotide binding protein, alpha subunit [Entophlyctis helioformis]
MSGSVISSPAASSARSARSEQKAADGTKLADARARSKAIDAMLAKDRLENEKLMSEPHILLLGSGDSGKTTFMKQLRILHGEGYCEEERHAFRRHIAHNIRTAVTSLAVWAASNHLGRESEFSKRIVAITDHYQGAPDDCDRMPHEIAKNIELIWADDTMRKELARANPADLTLQDTADYFLSQATKFTADDYLPTNEDILRIRLPTTQIYETVIRIQSTLYHFFDVAGQQRYRKQWIPYFDTVHNILFLISLASYDQVLAEDLSVNRMHDALTLFGQICNHELLKSIPITLFMNKKDLFEKKLATSDVKRYFPDYNNETRDLRKALRYFEKKFRAQNQQPEKRLWVHATCCTDSNAMRVIVITVVDTMLAAEIKSTGFM